MCTYQGDIFCFVFDKLEIANEIEQQRPVLEDVRRVGQKLSEDGFVKLVEPRLIPINKRWGQLDMKFEGYNVSKV